MTSQFLERLGSEVASVHVVDIQLCRVEPVLVLVSQARARLKLGKLENLHEFFDQVVLDPYKYTCIIDK